MRVGDQLPLDTDELEVYHTYRHIPWEHKQVVQILEEVVSIGVSGESKVEISVGSQVVDWDPAGEEIDESHDEDGDERGDDPCSEDY